MVLGIAKPTPTFASTVPPWICAFTPTTRPNWSSSGPPELPWLIGASVWITFGIVRPLGALDVAAECADDAGGHRAVEPERISDRVDGIADLDLARCFEAERMQRGRRSLHLDDRDVCGRIGGDDRGGRRHAVAKADANCRGALHDVVVGDDVALSIDHEPRAERAVPADFCDGEKDVAGLASSACR